MLSRKFITAMSAVEDEDELRQEVYKYWKSTHMEATIEVFTEACEYFPFAIRGYFFKFKDDTALLRISHAGNLTELHFLGFTPRSEKEIFTELEKYLRENIRLDAQGKLINPKGSVEI